MGIKETIALCYLLRYAPWTDFDYIFLINKCCTNFDSEDLSLCLQSINKIVKKEKDEKEANENIKWICPLLEKEIQIPFTIQYKYKNKKDQFIDAMYDLDAFKEYVEKLDILVIDKEIYGYGHKLFNNQKSEFWSDSDIILESYLECSFWISYREKHFKNIENFNFNYNYYKKKCFDHYFKEKKT